MEILIADDNKINLLLLNKILDDLNCKTILANDGLEAIEKFIPNKHSICLLDIMMPKMDGIEAAKKIKEISPETTIIFVSALNGDQDLLKGLDIAFDYITKPINVSIFRQKILNIIENVKLKKETKELLTIINEEHEMGLSLVNKMQQNFLKTNEDIDYYIKPLHLFSGDLVLTISSLAKNFTYILLIDAVGHGLPAAINTFPIYQPFESMAKKGLDLEDVIIELNNIIKKTMPINRFLAASIVKINHKKGSFDYWNGGIPSCFKLNYKTSKIQELKSLGLPLGLNQSIEIKNIVFEEEDQLIMCSDGIWEHNLINYKITNLLNLIDINQTSEKNIQKIESYNSFHDDATLIKAILK